jgi:hypothetical protein
MMYYVILFKKMVSVNYQSLIKIVRTDLEKSNRLFAFVCYVYLKDSFFELESSYQADINPVDNILNTECK